MPKPTVEAPWDAAPTPAASLRPPTLCTPLSTAIQLTVSAPWTPSRWFHSSSWNSNPVLLTLRTRIVAGSASFDEIGPMTTAASSSASAKLTENHWSLDPCVTVTTPASPMAPGCGESAESSAEAGAVAACDDPSVAWRVKDRMSRR